MINDENETKLGNKLSKLTTMLLMSLVLIFMISAPAFITLTWNDDSEKFSYGLRLVANMNQSSQAYNNTLTSFIALHQDISSPLIYLEVDNQVIWQSSTVSVSTSRITIIRPLCYATKNKY